jgi:hypothetical protein
MAKRKQMNNNPVTGGVRRRRTTGPTLAPRGNSTLLKYNTIGSNVTTDATGIASTSRRFIPGYPVGLTNSAGAAVAAAYSTGKFLPGTRIRWEPSVSFTTSGRVFVGFTDNPEVMVAFDGLTNAQAVNAVKALDTVKSWPVWQETEIEFPTTMRRKRFDINETIAVQVDTYDRSIQQYMLIGVEGAPASTTLGSFWYHDVLDVEGLHSITT